MNNRELNPEEYPVIRPHDRNFNMVTRPEHAEHYRINGNENYTADLLVNLLYERELFIDVGAHHGFFTILQATANKCTRVLAFEPAPDNCEVIKRNIELNKFDNIELFNCAVSDQDGTADFNIATRSSHCSFHKHHISGFTDKIPVKTVALDSVIKPGSYKSIVVKIDTEGHEIHVLDGMKHLLQDTEDIRLFIEFNPSCLINAGHRPEDLLYKVTQMGLEIYFIDDESRQTFKLAEKDIPEWQQYFASGNFNKDYFNILCIKKSKSLSIMFFSPSASFGGADQSLLAIIKYLSSTMGYVCSVTLPGIDLFYSKLAEIGISTRISEYHWWCSDEIYSAEENTARMESSLFNTLDGFKELQKINPDIIFTNTLDIPWGTLCAFLLNKPHVWFVREFGKLDHNWKFVFQLESILGLIKSTSNQILVNSDAVKNTLFKGIDGIATIYPEIDMPSLPENIENRGIYLNAGNLKLIIYSVIKETKGQEEAILAIREMIRNNYNVELAIMGAANPVYLDYLKRIVVDENLTDIVHFLDFHEHPSQIVNQADVVLVCSRHEAFGRTTAEAMLLKKPVIGTNSGGTAEIIQDGHTGLLYKPGDYHDLSEKIGYLYRHREKIQEFGENGFIYACRNFAASKSSPKVAELLFKLKGATNPLASPYLNFMLKLVHGIINGFEARLQAKETHITNLDTHITNIEATLQAKETHITNIEAILQAKEAYIHDLETQIQQINRGIMVQLMNRYLHILDRSLRPGTKPRIYYELGLYSIQVILNQGWGHFWQGFRQWLKQLIKLPHIGIMRQKGGYQLWLARNEPKPEDLKAYKHECLSFSYRPKISIITPVWNTDAKWLELAINSVLNQAYDNWELCLVDDASSKPHIKEVLSGYAKKDNRIRVKFLAKNLGIVGASNEALSLATGEFVGFLDHDDELRPNALYEVVKLLNEDRGLDLIYSDEDKIDTRGNRKEAFFKPDWSPDLLMSMNYICHFTVIRKDMVDDLGGFRSGFEGSQDYDLALRVTEKSNKIAHISIPLYSWRMVPGSAAAEVNAKPYAFSAAMSALRESLDRRGIAGDILEPIPGRYRVRYKIKSEPLVSIIIPTKDNVRKLERCINSIETKTTYRNYEIIVVDHESSDLETIKYLHSVSHRVIKYEGKFNFSRMNNLGVGEAKGDHIVFLNDDTAVIEPAWLEAMLEHSQRQEVGMVGAFLLYPPGSQFAGKIQHAGVFLGCGVAGHAFKYTSAKDLLDYSLRGVIRNCSAVTGACAMMRKDLFLAQGGFDENLPVAFNDIDLCLRLRDKGYLIIYTPFSVLYHYEGGTRGSYHPSEDETYMLSRWADVISKGDPYYNRNLALLREDLYIPPRPSVNIPLPLAVLLEIYYARMDLQRIFPEVTKGKYNNLFNWIVELGLTVDACRSTCRPYCKWYVNNVSDTLKPLAVLIELYNFSGMLQTRFPEVLKHDFTRLISWAYEVTTGKGDDDGIDKERLLPYAVNYQNGCTAQEKKAPGFSGKEQIINFYIHGSGLEIGALHNPTKLPGSAKVKYVDRMSTDELMHQYSDLDSNHFVNVDIIDDGEYLEKIPDSTQDFVIANHFLEHCQNPIAAIHNMLRVLKPAGVLYLTIPDKRHTFDRERPVTSINHLLKDYEQGPADSRRQHFEEWTRLVNKVDDDVKAEEQINHLMNMNYSIHFHVWSSAEIFELLPMLKEKLNFGFETVYLQEHIPEVIAVLKRKSR